MVVNKAMRDGAGVKAGDKVQIVMERDTEDRVVIMPAPLIAQISQHKKALAHWEKLSYTHKKEIARWHRSKKGRDPGRATEKSGSAIEDWRQVD
jgi:hypothetical protein